MNYALLDHLEIFAAKDKEEWHKELITEGIFDHEGTINVNKLNMMTGAFVTPLLDMMQEADMNLKEVYEHFENLYASGDVRAMYYFLYIIYDALEIDLPYMFLAVSSMQSVLQKYMHEFMLDFQDYLNDIAE